MILENDLTDKHCGKSCLIIGNGPSTNLLKNYNFVSKFDIILGINFAFLLFERYLDYQIFLEERANDISKKIIERDYRKDLPIILNRVLADKIVSEHKLKTNQDIYVFERKICNMKPALGGNILFEGYSGQRRYLVGTVLLQTIQIAAIMGFKHIYLVGAELLWKTNRYFYRQDEHKYQESDITSKIRDAIDNITVAHTNKIKAPQNVILKINDGFTTLMYYKTAQYIDKFIEEQCKPNNIEVYDFSDGLIAKAVQLNIDEFMRK